MIGRIIIALMMALPAFAQLQLGSGTNITATVTNASTIAAWVSTDNSDWHHYASNSLGRFVDGVTNTWSLVPWTYDGTTLVAGNTNCYVDDLRVWNAAAGGGTLWTPVDLGTNLLVWLDAADTSTLWADTNATTQATFLVARWDDKSGNDRDWYYVGGYPYIYDSGIRGGNTNALRHTASAIWTGTSGMVFAVGRQLQQYSAWGIMNKAKAGGTASHTPYNTTTGYDSFMRTTRPAYTTPRNLANNGATPGAYALFSATYTGTRAEIWFDGTRAYDAAQTFEAIAATNQYLLAQSMVAPLAANVNHQLNEVVMTTYLSAANRVLVEGYLAHHNNTESYLPTNHLYYAAPPYK